MSRPKFSEKKVSDALVKAVETIGRDYVYDVLLTPDGSCMYSPTGEVPTGCIVGETFRILDEDLYDEVAGVVESISSFMFEREVARKDEQLFSHEVVAALQSAQDVQDKGLPWGEAEKAFFDAFEDARNLSSEV
jgi:hypothetical protein